MVKNLKSKNSNAGYDTHIYQMSIDLSFHLLIYSPPPTKHLHK